mmetsp:Transcript_3245/g.2789  ORF Transcript_3245/g.2789 Transcript_3245/m.2789 type:complete len:84 (+) Transcript_3245:1272-1523(+)
MGCGITPQKGEKELARTDGLFEGHAFSLIKCIEEDNVKLLQVRNPWGAGQEWNGRFSDEDVKSWDAHPKLKNKYWSDEGDGLF